MFWRRNASESIPAATASMSMTWASANVVCCAPGARSAELWRMPIVESIGLLITL